VNRRQALGALGLAGLLAAAPQPAWAASEPGPRRRASSHGAGWPGRYRVSEGPDLAGQLVLQGNGRFAYALIAGALDENAQGSWREDGGLVRLTTSPKPVGPVFAPGNPGNAPDGRLRVAVTWPSGRGIPGIDFRVGFAVGEPILGYTQEEGWTEPDDSVPDPLWIELVEPVHGIVSPRFPVPAGQRLLAFVLTPNDIGVVDFTDAAFRRDGEAYLLSHPRGGDVRFVRAGK